jgi:hypothetical protein
MKGEDGQYAISRCPALEMVLAIELRQAWQMKQL